MSVPIFLSSTFLDMARERDVLARLVFPRLRAELRSVGFSPTELDLRWGITELMARDAGAATLCLEYLAGCAPFVFGVVGERVGWQPPLAAIARFDDGFFRTLREGMGMTEIELRYAVRRSKALSSGPFPVFVRSSSTPDVPANESLRQWLQSEAGVVAIEYDELDKFEHRAFEALKTLILREDEVRPIRVLSTVVLPRVRQLRRIGWAARGRRPVMLTASSGAGTSWLLRRWTERRGNALYVDARSAFALADRSETDDHGAPVSDVGMSSDDRSTQLLDKLLERLADPTDVKSLVIDHFESLFSTVDRTDLAGIPTRLPRGTRLVCATSSERLARQADESGWRLCRIPRIGAADGAAHAQAYLARYGKTLTAEQLDRVRNAPWVTSFRALTLVLDELRRFGHVETLDARLDTLARCEDDRQVAGEVIGGLQSAFPAQWSTAVADAVMLLAHSLRGLDADLLATALGRAAGVGGVLPPHLFGAIRLSLGQAVVDRGDVLDIDSNALLDWVGAEGVQSSGAYHRTLDALEQTLSSGAADARALHAPRIAYARGGAAALASLLLGPNEALATLDTGEVFMDGWLAQLGGAERHAVARSWCDAARFGDIDAEQAWRLGAAAGRMGERASATRLLSHAPSDRSDASPALLGARDLLLARLGRNAAVLSEIARRCLSSDCGDGYRRSALLVVLDAIADNDLHLSVEDEGRVYEATRAALDGTINRSFSGQALLLLGQLDLVRARFAVASTRFGAAERAARRTGNVELLCRALERASAAALELHQFRRARRCSAECLEIACRSGLANLEEFAFERAIETEERRANWSEAYALASAYLDRSRKGPLDAKRALQTFERLERG